MKPDSRPPMGQITISEPVMHIYRQAAEKDHMDVTDFISQQLAFWAGCLAQQGWAVPPEPPEEVSPDDKAGTVPPDAD